MQKKSRGLQIGLIAALCIGLVVVIELVIPIRKGLSAFDELTKVSFKSHQDHFRIEVLDVGSNPSLFMQRIQVRCENDMNVGIWVSDLKKVGLFRATGPSGETYYREGEPHKAGQSSLIHAVGRYSTCEIRFELTGDSTNTVWHSKISTRSRDGWLSHSEETSGVDTTLHVRLVVSEVQTNWPNSYERGSAIPLIRLGDYNILLSVK